MSSISNQVYSGYQAWAERIGYTASYDTKGPWFDYSAFADSAGTLVAIQSRNAGKAYFEFNFTRQITTPEVEYFFGVVTDNHSNASRPGMSAESWALCTENVGFYHDSVGITSSDSTINGIVNASRGWYYDYTNHVYYSQYVVKVAIDFDAGKLWFGVFNGSIDVWDGDPATGTSPTYTFTPNTALRPAIGWKFIHTGFSCTASVQLGCSRDFARKLPPSGFDFWDTFDYQSEIIADSPIAYWLGSPHIYSETFLNNSLGYPGQFADSSVNQRYAEHNSSYANNFLNSTNGVKIFPALPQYCWYASSNIEWGKYALSLSSSMSFTIEACVYITGDGAVNGASDVLVEGSGLIHNQLSATQQASFTLSQIWVGLALRGRRIKFRVAPAEATTSQDLSDGEHHIAAVWDFTAGSLLLYIDGALSAQVTGVTPDSNTSSFFVIGAMLPVQTNGWFPGYFREIALYGTALNSTRIQEHYQRLNEAALPNPWDVVYPRQDWLVPSFIV